MDWLPHIDLGHWIHSLVLQTPTHTPTSSPNVEDLKAQIELLKTQNTQITTEYLKKLEFVSKQGDDLNNSFKDYMNWALFVFGLFGSVFLFFFKQSIDEARETAKKLVNQQVEARVTEIVGAELEKVQRLLDRERVVSNAALDYFLPSGQANQEIQILQARGFERIEFRTTPQQIRRGAASLIVIDLANFRPDGTTLLKDMPEADREAQAQETVQTVIDVVPDETILIIYVSGQIRALTNFLQRENPVSIANNRITLVGALADAAYVTQQARRSSL
jgi:hypothetical protein